MQFNLVKVNLLGIKIRTSRLGLRIFFLDKAVHRYCVNQDSSVERTLPETSFPETLWLCKPTVASAVQVKKQHVEVLYFCQSGISKQNLNFYLTLGYFLKHLLLTWSVTPADRLRWMTWKEENAALTLFWVLQQRCGVGSQKSNSF